MQPKFLELARIIRIHQDSIDAYGGDPGIRDRGLLESAMMQPCAAFGGQYLHEDLATMAAAYLFHLVMNHPFVDGNKRIGAMAAFIFLDMNGVDFTAGQDEFKNLVLDVASGKLDKSDVVAFFKRHVKT